MALKAELNFDHAEVVKLIEAEAMRRFPDLVVKTLSITSDKYYEAPEGDTAVRVYVRLEQED